MPIVEAALLSQKRNSKSEYLRAFGHVLKDRGFRPEKPIMHAMAITATIVIDDSNVVVTYDDVRKAIKSVTCKQKHVSHRKF
jgi:hypothetical protein